MDKYVQQFIEMKDKLFVKGIILKQYVDLKKNNWISNEYRVFYLFGKVLSVSPNSNQKGMNILPDELLIRIYEEWFVTQ